MPSMHIKNEERDLLVKIEHLIHDNMEKLFVDGKFVYTEIAFPKKGEPYNKEITVTEDDFWKFWNFIQRIDDATEKARADCIKWNKEHPDAHRKHCRDYARRHAEKLKKYHTEYMRQRRKEKRNAESKEN